LTLATSPQTRDDGFDLQKLADICCERVAKEFSESGKILAPIPLPVMEIDHEAESVVTVWLQVPAELATAYKAGQFFMCWNPYDAEGGMSRTNFNSEKPYSVGDIKIDRAGIDETTAADEGKVGNTLMGFTIKDLGRQSGELTRMSIGDWLAIRGPFGTTFPTPKSGSTLILVSGGIGSTPMHMAAKEARNKLGDRMKIHAVMGFRNADEAHYIQRMEGLCDSLTITTDDGTLGVHGYPTQPLEELLKGLDPNNCTLLTCGPEPMMKPVLAMAVEAGIDCYAAMERYLPCAIAVCGLCMVGDRLTCRQGPVMEGDWLLQQSDFGQHHG
jgi:dihydroorotate dehydrogenase electron transfer subunit|tara:strand:- start:215 stop:1198 length:984 start_codon:yes stop_codon:yes gene_type:complete